MEPHLSTEGNLIMSELKNLRTELSTMKSEFSDLLSKKNETIQKLEEEVNKLNSKVEKLESLIDDGDAYERRDTVIISGSSIPPVSQGEICTNIARQLLQEKLNLVIPETDISTAHRLGKKTNTQSPDTRSIIVKFCRRDSKRRAIAASKHLRNPAIYINESLTPMRRTIFKTLRSMKRAHPDLVRGCTTYEGRVFAFTKSTVASAQNRDKRHLINSYGDLIGFCREYVKKPLDLFLDTWPH